MTRVDFYLLEEPSPERHDRMLCRVVEKAWQRGHTVYVLCADAHAAQAFDDQLWQFQDTSFVPHALYSAADGETRVIVGLDAAEATAHDVLVNLAPAVPEAATRYTRVIESAGFDDVSRSEARKRYKHYQDRGFPLNLHKVNA
jgi:DNA polymerase-3 subunit chi